MRNLILFLFFIVTSFSVSFADEVLAETSPKISGEKVLMIGDSHTCGFFGDRMHQNILESDLHFSRVVTYASWGSSPDNFLTGHPTNYKIVSRDNNQKTETKGEIPTELIQTLLDDVKPQFLVVALGANLVKQDKAYGERVTREFLKKVKPQVSKCIWVGPPEAPQYFNQEDFNATYDMLIKVTKELGCQFIDSRPLVKYPLNQGDHLHFDYIGWGGRKGKKLANSWADQVYHQLEFEFESLF